MAAHKHALEDSSSTRKSKKSKVDAAAVQPATTNVPEEVDFPRGGGTSFTPLEVKTIRDEAIKEAKDELFGESNAAQKLSKKRKRTTEDGKEMTSESDKKKSDHVRIEHLNYKRMHTGMKVYGQVQSVQPIYMTVSLPNQLFAYVPITNVSPQLTASLEKSDSESEEEDESNEDDTISDLSDIFFPGNYVRAVVHAVHPAGYTDPIGLSKSRDDVTRASRRVELSLLPEKVNAGVKKTDLVPGFTLSASVRSVEDHGYLLDFGLSEVSGFLPFKDQLDKKSRVGELFDVAVTKLSPNKRTCHVSAKAETLATSAMTEVSSVTSVLPGALVQCLVTAVHATGVNVRIMGFFDGTIEQQHLEHDSVPKVSDRVKARILYDVVASPPRFTLSLLDHIIKRSVRKVGSEESSNILIKYPVGIILEEVKVDQIEPERGMFVEVQPGLSAFVHISDISDDHLLSISTSSPWKPGSLHRARVVGYYALEGMLRLSMKQSVLKERLYQVADLQVGEIIKGTIKNLTDTGLFVSISGNFDGVVWPNHYADITLRHPAKRFKVGGTIKCRALVVDPERKRVSLTAKKSLIDSSLPLVTSFETTQVGLVTNAVVFKVLPKQLMVEFYNNVKAVVPLKEASEEPLPDLAEAFPLGKVVKVRIIRVNTEERRLVASIRQAAPNFKAFNMDLSSVEVGNTVKGEVHEVHKENATLSLTETGHRAVVSLANLANSRKVSIGQIRTDLKIGDTLEDLIVLSKNMEKGLVVVATKPKSKAASGAKQSLSMDTVAVGKVVSGRVTRHIRQGSLVKLSSRIGGILHPTDTSDDFDSTAPFLPVDSVIKAVVVGIDQDKKQLTLSTRRSKLQPDTQVDVVDREIVGTSDLQVGDTVRGFIKNVTDHGLFVTVGRTVDARVQIRELFDDYVKEWKDRFQVNQVVKGRILSVDSGASKVELTLRSGDLNKPSAPTIDGLEVGQKIEGTVKRVEDYGIFIQIRGSKLTGLCHKSELSDNASADVESALQNFHEGDPVKAVVVKLDKRRISLSMKPSYFDAQDFDDRDVNMVLTQREEDEEGSDPTPADELSVASGDDESDDEDVQIAIASQKPFQSMKTATQTTMVPDAPALPVTGGFQWSAPQAETQPSDSSGDESSEEESGGGKKKRRRKEIEQDLTADMHTKMPESNADFERILLGSPNSSYLWIQYMSFQLQLSEVDKAREIARRALDKIHFRQEQEKQNVWIALLNLECSYGTDESLESTFQEAARANDSKTIHLRLALIFDQAGKHQKAEEQYKRTCKKFGQSSKVWSRFSEHYLREGKLDESRKLLPRALQSLEKRKHLKTISAFAQLEYKHGEPERGKTLFEGIVDSHPKRWDLWSIYMDKEAGQSDIQSLRNLFERVLTIKMTSHKAKSFFKKWLELERRLGDEEGAEVVKQKAVEWTQRAQS